MEGQGSADKQKASGYHHIYALAHANNFQHCEIKPVAEGQQPQGAEQKPKNLVLSIATMMKQTHPRVKTLYLEPHIWCICCKFSSMHSFLQ
mmetsp:Transcript_25227/g.74536  ORF Transcript_25227/g.74536 Transcript_25227/m.74536 type:complete len:91 (+) Transcript_25227:1444-1716(+)